MCTLTNCSSSTRDHPYIMSAKGLGEWVQKMTILSDVQYCIYAEIVARWVGQKNSKNMLDVI